jgi:hypothetical protein
MVHHDDGLEHFRTRVAHARERLDDFGIAGPCGYGRVQAVELPGVLRAHRESLDELRRGGYDYTKGSNRTASRRSHPYESDVHLDDALGTLAEGPKLARPRCLRHRLRSVSSAGLAKPLSVG